MKSLFEVISLLKISKCNIKPVITHEFLIKTLRDNMSSSIHSSGSVGNSGHVNGDHEPIQSPSDGAEDFEIISGDTSENNPQNNLEALTGHEILNSFNQMRVLKAPEEQPISDSVIHSLSDEFKKKIAVQIQSAEEEYKPRSIFNKALSRISSFLGGGFITGIRTAFRTVIYSLRNPIRIHLAHENECLDEYSLRLFRACGKCMTDYAEMDILNRVQLRRNMLQISFSGIFNHQPEKAAPIHYLSGDEKALISAKESEGLFAIPYTFPSYPINHITMIVVDFKNQDVCFFDSKGITAESADFTYSLQFSMKNELERLGKVCFGDDWSSKGHIKSNSKAFQNDVNNCGRWVALFIEEMCKKKSWDSTMNELTRIVDEKGSKKTIEDFVDNFKVV